MAQFLAQHSAMPELRYSTIKDFIAGGMTLSVHCSNMNCIHSASVDLEALADRLGEGFDLYATDIRPRFRCKACSASGAAFTVSTAMTAGGLPLANCTED